jgi:hypothetical protein
MLDSEEISKLRRTRQRLKREISAYAEPEGSAALALSLRLKGLIDEIGTTVEKSKTLWNPALETSIKLAKKGMKLSKGVLGFEKEVANEFENGRLSVNMGRRLISVIGHVKSGEVEEAKKEFAYLGRFIDLSKEYSAAEEAVREAGRVLRREENRVQKVQGELVWLEGQAIDETKVARHRELADATALLVKSREEYLSFLLAKPVSELLSAIEAHPLRERLPPPDSPGPYLSANPRIAKCSIEEFCGFFDLNEKRLSHLCDIAGFRKAIAPNRGFFDELRFLRRGKFLAVDVDDDKLLDFYASMGSGDAVGRIRALRQGRQADREESEKSEHLDKKRAELSKYSKTGLENELENIGRLLAMLESEDEEKSEGLLGALGALFSRK